MKRSKSRQQQPCPSSSPLPNPQSSSLFRDISNFKTPKRLFQNPSFHSPHSQQQFFTALKQTPSSSSSFTCRRPFVAKSKLRSNAARKLKAFELEQSRSSRKVQIQKENSLKSLSNVLTVWLNFLFENPKAFGCDPCKSTGEGHVLDSETDLSSNGKRVCCKDSGVAVDREWRGSKRQRNCSWSVANVDESAFHNSKMFSALHESLHHVCSLEDLKQRMSTYLSLSSCMEIFTVMAQVTKNIDEGRLKMKAHCPIVTDFGMKETATKILMGYSPVWLRIGLYIVFGGDTLLSGEDINFEEDTRFLKMIVTQQFFSHPALAKAYAYNKKVEGLYRPGYFESLGNVILKRFLLLVLVLDRAKSQSSLPLTHGIDGLDGGSPLLFALQSNIKSSRQVINDFLSSELMHGEGNILTHLVTLGYKVPYQQNPLIEYEFRVTDVFTDLQDGIRLCRAIQLLKHDPSILLKLVLPSDTCKKNLLNCGVALQYLRDAGVPLHDEDNMMIYEEDISQGDKELVISLLWNMFVHLQLPLLVNRPLLLKEISRIRGVDEDLIDSQDCSPLEALLNWIQGICEKYAMKIDNFNSLVDGKAMWCLLDYYYRKDLQCSCSIKDHNESSGKESIVSAAVYTDAVHNFPLSQKLMTLLGNFPEVLQLSDILEHNGPCNERSVVILLVFLSSELIVKNNMDQLNFHKFLGCTCPNADKRCSNMGQSSRNLKTARQEEDTRGINEDSLRKFEAIKTWWQDMAERNCKFDTKAANSILQYPLTRSYGQTEKEEAATVIQSYFKRFLEYKRYMKLKRAVPLVQTNVRARSKQKYSSENIVMNLNIDEKILNEGMEESESESFQRHVVPLDDKEGYIKLNKSVLLIQQAARAWISRRRHGKSMLIQEISLVNAGNASLDLEIGATTRPRHTGGTYQRDQDSFISEENDLIVFKAKAVEKNQLPSLGLESGSIIRSTHTSSAVQRFKHSLISEEDDLIEFKTKAVEKIQHAWKRFTICTSVSDQHLKATMIQSHFRGWLSKENFQRKRRATVTIQRGYRKFQHVRFLKYNSVIKSAIFIQSHVRRWLAKREAFRQKHLITVIQSCCRAWLMKRHLLMQRRAAIKIQSALRFHQCWKDFRLAQNAVIQVQSFIRGHNTRRKLLGASCFRPDMCITGCLLSFELQIIASSVLKLQKWWRDILLLRSKKRSAIIIQSHFRAFITRREVARKRQHIVLLQSCCRAWLIKRHLLTQKGAAIKIQTALRFHQCWKDFSLAQNAAIQVQSFIRGQIARRKLLGASCFRPDMCITGCFMSFELQIIVSSVLKLQKWWRDILMLRSKKRSAIIIQSHFRAFITRREIARMRQHIVLLQSCCRAWLMKRHLLTQRRAAIKIQSALRFHQCWKDFRLAQNAAIQVQSFIRGHNARRKLLGASCFRPDMCITGCFMSFELQIIASSVLKLQKWWRDILLLRSKKRSAIIIQSHFRAFITRREVARMRQHIVLLQAYWKGCLARKESREQLHDLRLRVKKSAANVDDSMRLINRHLVALSELLGMKSVSSILHTCATLDFATEHSQKCCEKLVEANAVDTLLRLIQSVSQSIPDQQVLKHAISTLRNLARYSHLLDVLINNRKSVETIFWVLLRNKEEAYFVASELLKKICSNPNGVKAVRSSPALVKRLHGLVEDLTRKVSNEKKKGSALAAKDNTDRRLSEALELWKLTVAR